MIQRKSVEVLEENSSEVMTLHQNLLGQIKMYLTENFRGLKENKRGDVINYEKAKKVSQVKKPFCV